MKETTFGTKVTPNGLNRIWVKKKNDDVQFRNEKLINTSCGGGMGIKMK